MAPIKETKPCECGCGTLIPKFGHRGKERKFVHPSHATRKKTKTKLKCYACKELFTRNEVLCNRLQLCNYCAAETKLCECGCGQVIGKYGYQGVVRKYVEGWHVRNGMKLSEKTKERMRCSAKKKFENPIEHIKTSLGQYRRYKRSEEHIKSSLGQYRRYECPEARKKTGDAIRKAFKELQHYNNDGENNPNWKGGIQYEPYDGVFDAEFKDLIRARQGYICADSNLGECSVDEKALSVHHIDGNKKNSTVTNCIALCNTHHMRSHNTVAQERNYRMVETYMEPVS